MKQIKKLKLINWHFFDNQEINFSDINVITGENGTGKSTILDAIHYLQSGGTCKFNTAANTLSHGRTVENYLKARIGIENKEFLREQSDIIGHIAIEYFDTLYGKIYVLGCVIQLVSNQLSSVDFYEIKGQSWNEDLFFTKDDEVRSFDNLLKQGLAEHLEITRVGQPRQSNSARAKAVRSALGVPEKYDVLFSKAMSFEPLNDINAFAIDFLLPEESIDLTTIKGSMDDYRELQVILQNELKRKELLEPIASYKERYEKALNDRDALELLGLQAGIEVEKDNIAKNKDEIQKAKATIKSNESRIKTHNDNRRDYEFEARKLEDDENYNALKEAKRTQQVCSEKINGLNAKISFWESQINTESELAKKIGTQLDLSKVIERKNYKDYQDVLFRYGQRLNEISNSNQEEYDRLSIQATKVNDDIKQVTTEIKDLEANSYAFPNYVTELQTIISKEILDKKGESNPKMIVFCSLLNVLDEEWRYAIEGLLGRSRFDLFLKTEHIQIAKECFDKNAELKKHFGVGVVANIKDDCLLMGNSLATKVRAARFDKNKGEWIILDEANRYLKSLLNDIACVDNSSEFVLGQKAITKEGLYFDGEAMRFVDRDAANKPYIGQESIKLRLDECNRVLESLKNIKKKLDKDISSANTIKSLIRNSKLEELSETEDLWSQYRDEKSKETQIESQIKQLIESDQSLLNRSQQITAYKQMALKEKNDADVLENKNKSLLSDITRWEVANETSESKIIINENAINENHDIMLAKNPNLEELLLSLRGDLRGSKLDISVFQQKGTVSSQLKNYESVISRAMSDYCHNYPNELKPEMANFIEFVKRYNKIVEDELAKLEPEVEKARVRSVQELREHFISKVRSSITDAKIDINNLNKVLRKHPFGTDNEVFEFYTSKSKDSLLSGVYRIAMETNQDTVENNILTEDLDAVSQETMKKVFEILSTNEDDAEYKKLRKDLLDYRNYLNYDIKININNSDDTLFYSKNQDSKSGGETQTPFYALIAGAFQSVINGPEKNKQSPCSLVVFDEAFNNMDGERIKQMLLFYKELNIQLIISVPSSRFGYISPFADNIICLAKTDNNVGVYEAIRNKE